MRSRRWVRRLSMAPRRLPPPQKEPRREPEKSEAQRARHQQPRRLAEAVQDRLLRAARRADLRPAVVGGHPRQGRPARTARSEEHTSELQSIMRISYAVICLKKKKHQLQQEQTMTPPSNSTSKRDT